MSSYTREEKSGQWAVNDGKIMWKLETVTSTFDPMLREWIEAKPVIAYQTPEEIGYSKSVTFYIVTFDEIPNMRKRGLKEKVYFKEKVVAKIREDFPHMYIWLNSDSQNIQGQLVKTNKFFLKEINEGKCFIMPLKSNDYVKIEKFEPKAITSKEATELSQKYNYVFDAVENDLNEGELYRVNVTKYIENPM